MEIKMKIQYNPHELMTYCKDSIRLFFNGLAMILWFIILTIINIFAWLWQEVSACIKKAPLLSVAVTFAVMDAIAMGVYRQMKVKLTTARWQRDSLEQRLDSIKILDANNTSFFRYHTAEPTDKNLEDQ